MLVRLMEEGATIIAGEVATEFRRQVESIRSEMGQVRNLVQDAIGKLTDSFNGLRDSSDHQLQLVTSLTTSMDMGQGADDPAGEGHHKVNIRGFVSETDKILRTFVDHIILVSRQSMEMVHRIDELSTQMNEVVELLHDINSISEQTNVLSLNARIVAARAGQAGEAFSVVASEVRKLARNSHEFSDRIDGVVRKSKRNIEQAKSIIEVMASKDMSFAIESKGRVDEMMAEVSEIDRFTEETIHKVTALADRISSQVGTAVMSMQFEDMVTQLSHSMEKKFNILENFSRTMDPDILFAGGLSDVERRMRLEEVLASQVADFNAVDRGAVQQSSMDEGEVELF
ncbi:MAG: methyl-accepting chemotaxis protein [Magnetococcales bacterium]|nr:methyl-accepting chemotaxis protein [Magnetococcales bacterium]